MADTDKTLAWALLGGAVAALIAAEKDEHNRGALRAFGLALAVSGAAKYAGASLGDLLQRPAELLGGLWDRLRGAPAPAVVGAPEREIPPGVTPGTPVLPPTVEGPLGQVRFIAPANGGEIDLAPFESTYRVRLELANATADELLEGTLELDIRETPFLRPARTFTVLGPRVALRPRERRTVELSVETHAAWSPSVTVSVNVRVGRHWLGAGSWTLS